MSNLASTKTDTANRISISLTPRETEMLEKLAAHLGMSVQDAIRDSIGVNRFVSEELAKGAEIISEIPGKPRRVMALLR